jgi:hypothetical protein
MLLYTAVPTLSGLIPDLWSGSAEKALGASMLIAMFAVMGLFVAAWMVYWWLWAVMGREVMLIDGDLLTLRWETPIYALKRRYDVRQVRNLRASTEPSFFHGLFWPVSDRSGLANGHIAFDYRGETVRFASALDEVEARDVVGAIVCCYESLAPGARADTGPFRDAWRTEVAPQARRATVSDDEGILRIRVPVRRRWSDWPGVVASGAFLALWLLALLNPVGPALPGLISDLWSGQAELALGASVSIALFALMGLFAARMVYWWLWAVMGREVMLIDGDLLTLRCEMPICSLKRRYDLHQVRDLRASTELASFHGWFWPVSDIRGLADGHIAFDYRNRTVRIASALDEVEARDVVGEIIRHRASLASDAGADAVVPSAAPRAEATPRPPRARVEQDGDILRITLPNPRQWYVVLVLSALAIAGIGQLAAPYGQHLQSWTAALGEAPVVPINVLVITDVLSSAVFLVWLLWVLFGQETVVVNTSLLVISRQLLMFKRTRSFDRVHVSGLRVPPVARQGLHSVGDRLADALGLGRGRIAFDYGARTYRFAAAVDEAEAGIVVEHIRGKWDRRVGDGHA